MAAGAAVIPAARHSQHHADVEHRFRQDSDFWYLTGFDEANAVALLLGHRDEERFVLFVEPRDPQAETWNGHRWGTEGAVERFGADVAHPLGDLPTLLPRYLDGAEAIAFRIGQPGQQTLQARVLEAWAEQLEQRPRRGHAAARLVDPTVLLHRQRLIKDAHELERLREAARIAAEAHELARQAVRPGIAEYDVQALLEHYFLAAGAREAGYPPIVAGGGNACILHYTSNRERLRNGDLLLIDAGCSLMDYYNSDITRTFPVNGCFSGEQRELYTLTLAAQQAALERVSPGATAEQVHGQAVEVLVKGLCELGLLRGDPQGIIERGDYRHLYPHRTGHWLGLDVHDVGAYRLGEHPVVLEPGMVLTVEPGLYVGDLLAVPEGQPPIEARWKGIGIRIEDDVVVTAEGAEVLSAAAAKDTAAMEER
ncbi:MAG: M24 family metallopeptidase [Aphanocapsa feldmannii 277cV]|uniref:Xaa-Pro aminopeptidase n=2 Tax=Aphanocapsa feldmannii TaxID=192050 RepID=A0A524RM41_9CHRO|nr:MAG: M24 family metallopeptidase [Aphanocapsa feldmannii 277cV]